MKTDNVYLEKVGVDESQYPTKFLPEVAFVGRSNVGKSSLINCMINKKSLARTSQTPGKTRTINFYNIDEKLYFVDLPGYGYARVSRTESDKWGKMIEDYLINRKMLKFIIMLIDIRRKPQENDLQMYKWLKHYEKEIVFVGTKCDKVKKQELNKNILLLRETFNLPNNDIVIPFSSTKKTGRDKLWQTIIQKSF